MIQESDSVEQNFLSLQNAFLCALQKEQSPTPDIFSDLVFQLSSDVKQVSQLIMLVEILEKSNFLVWCAHCLWYPLKICQTNIAAHQQSVDLHESKHKILQLSRQQGSVAHFMHVGVHKAFIKCRT